MTNTKQNYIAEYNELINAVIATHNDLKIKSNLAYQKAVGHGVDFGDWFLFADFITKMLVNNITSPKHLYNILKQTNPNLVYNRQKASISQNKNFDKTQTQILPNIWLDILTENKKQTLVFDENKLLLSIQNLIKKAVKNNIDNAKIKTLLINESNKI